MKKIQKSIPVFLILLLLSGCGKDAAMDEFHDSMDAFYESLETSANALEAIDPDAETAADEMLTQLDAMDQLFKTLAAIEVPEDFEDQFGSIEDMADEASEYMTEAGALYHEAYAQDILDESLASAAGENYTRAMKRVSYIAVLLQGRVPEDDNITVIESDDEPDWTGADLPEEATAAAE